MNVTHTVGVTDLDDQQITEVSDVEIELDLDTNAPHYLYSPSAADGRRGVAKPPSRRWTRMQYLVSTASTLIRFFWISPGYGDR